jgi:2-polyprenyl-6-methoxyphenol hydroxylase-like FAD-dependent oxidoreductase
MRLTDLTVIVAGAGTGGCAAALLLARAGARVTIMERVPQPRAVGAGIAMAENGLAVLESLGLLPLLDGAGRAVSGGRITDAAGRTLLAPPAPEPRILMLRRATLQGVLLDAIAGTAGIERRFGAEVLRASTDGTVTVRDEAGTAASTADLVIGADGVHSRVRDGGAFGARVRRSGISYVRMLVRAGLETNSEAWTAAGIFGAFPVEGGTYAFASCGSPECRAALAAQNVRAFRAAWDSVYAPAVPILADVATFDDLIVNEVIQVDCDRWADGRLVLVGDAAHAMAPNVGQGANSALVDAAVLLDELRRASSVSDALTAYERRRRPRVKRVATMAARLGQVAEWTSPVARAMRDRVLMPMANMVATPDAMAMVLQEPTARLLAIGRA